MTRRKAIQMTAAVLLGCAALTGAATDGFTVIVHTPLTLVLGGVAMASFIWLGVQIGASNDPR